MVNKRSVFTIGRDWTAWASTTTNTDSGEGYNYTIAKQIVAMLAHNQGIAVAETYAGLSNLLLGTTSNSAGQILGYDHLVTVIAQHLNGCQYNMVEKRPLIHGLPVPLYNYLAIAWLGMFRDDFGVVHGSFQNFSTATSRVEYTNPYLNITSQDLEIVRQIFGSEGIFARQLQVPMMYNLDYLTTDKKKGRVNYVAPRMYFEKKGPIPMPVVMQMSIYSCSLNLLRNTQNGFGRFPLIGVQTAAGVSLPGPIREMYEYYATMSPSWDSNGGMLAEANDRARILSRTKFSQNSYLDHAVFVDGSNAGSTNSFAYFNRVKREIFALGAARSLIDFHRETGAAPAICGIMYTRMNPDVITDCVRATTTAIIAQPLGVLPVGEQGYADVLTHAQIAMDPHGFMYAASVRTGNQTAADRPLRNLLEHIRWTQNSTTSATIPGGASEHLQLLRPTLMPTVKNGEKEGEIAAYVLAQHMPDFVSPTTAVPTNGVGDPYSILTETWNDLYSAIITGDGTTNPGDDPDPASDLVIIRQAVKLAIGYVKETLTSLGGAVCSAPLISEDHTKIGLTPRALVELVTRNTSQGNTPYLGDATEYATSTLTVSREQLMAYQALLPNEPPIDTGVTAPGHSLSAAHALFQYPAQRDRSGVAPDEYITTGNTEHAQLRAEINAGKPWVSEIKTAFEALITPHAQDSQQPRQWMTGFEKLDFGQVKQIVLALRPVRIGMQFNFFTIQEEPVIAQQYVKFGYCFTGGFFNVGCAPASAMLRGTGAPGKLGGFAPVNPEGHVLQYVMQHGGLGFLAGIGALTKFAKPAFRAISGVAKSAANFILGNPAIKNIAANLAGKGVKGAADVLGRVVGGGYGKILGHIGDKTGDATARFIRGLPAQVG